jgi:hypothetical protein
VFYDGGGEERERKKKRTEKGRDKERGSVRSVMGGRL